MNSDKLRKTEAEGQRALKQEKDAARKRTALRMLADGFTLAEAARAVKADERTVKAWRNGVEK